MTGLSNAVSQSLLTRFLANIIAFLAVLVSLIVLAYQAIHGESLNPWFVGIAGVSIGQAASVLGINQGVTLQPLVVKQPSVKSVTTKKTEELTSTDDCP